jgi:hypothetical protein
MTLTLACIRHAEQRGELVRTAGSDGVWRFQATGQR